MPLKNIKDDISIASEGGRGFIKRARSMSVSRNRSGSRPRDLSSSLSVASGSTMRSSSRIRSKRFFGKRRGSTGPDDVSVSDSLCSGVLRGDLEVVNCIGGSIGGSTANSDRLNGAGMIETSKTSTRLGVVGKMSSDMLHASGRSASSNPAVIPGGVADFNENFNRDDAEGNRSIQSLTSSGTGPSAVGLSQVISKSVTDDAARREQRKERVKEKLERYKSEQKQLKYSCVALEQQLAQTTDKLKEVDSKAAFKIDALESELRETRGGLEQVAKQSTKEVTDQGDVIKTLGKKLIRQAHVIKRQKAAVDQYKMKIDALHEEMAMQDERDSKRAEEYCQLKDEYDGALDQKVQMQNMLQENIEEMMDLKNETEKDAKSIMELEFKLQQKDATLDRVENEVMEKTKKAGVMETELEEKNLELEDLCKKLKLSDALVEATKNELQSVNEDLEEFRAKFELLERANEKDDARSMMGSLKQEAGSKGTPVAPAITTTAALAPTGPSLAQIGRTPSFLGWTRPRDSMLDVETFEEELQAKDITIQSLNETVTEHEDTIQSLKSDMVKMSSSYKQDSYLKRKEIAKLKQMNAEYALKLRALEKAFKSVGGSSSAITSATMHGLSRNSSSSNSGVTLSRHGKSMHSIDNERRDSLASKADKEAAVQARLGLAPSRPQRRESRIVVESNFFDGSDSGGSQEGRKGEFPEEC